MNHTYRADLHCHSYFSDGVLSPAELLERAAAAHLNCLALTDHDTVAGSEQLRDLAKSYAITIINGVELSVRWKMHDIHVVGLNIECECPALTVLLAKQADQRRLRAQTIARLLESVGLNNGFQKACDLAGHDRIGRPHLAQVLVNEGLASDLQTAFKRYLVRGRLAYVPTSWITVDESIMGIKQSGGFAVIAHPLKYKLTRSKLHALISEFKQVGGVGIEVVSGEMPITQVGEMVGLCSRFDLLASTGSDYHSDLHSRVKLGQQRALPLTCKPIWERWSHDR